MAVFERKKEDKVVIDDSKPYTLEIKEAQNINGHIEYKIEVCRYPDIEQKWMVTHRFSDFVNLHSSLKTPTIDLPHLPPKKVFGNTDKDFINNRKTALQTYLNKLSEIYFVSISPQFGKFVDPRNYNDNFSEDAHQSLLISLRSSGSHEISQQLPNIGTRLRKKYFLGRPLGNSGGQHSLWWAPYGPDRVKHLRDIHAALTALLNCQHSYIVSAVSCIATDSGVCVVRPWFSQGSLRDYIYGVKPQFDFLLKYSNNKRRDIPIKTCAAYGRQILEAVAFLHEKGISHGCLHTGNVVIESNVCQLVDLENLVMGLPHPLRRFMIKVKKINSPQAADIYAFGHLLYEMVFHNPLLSETCDQFPKESSPLCRSVLESILSSEACRNGLPSASALLTHPFFNEVPLRSYQKPFLKLPSSVKLALTSTQETALERLKEDQKKVKLLRQKFRAEAVLSGSEVTFRSNKKNLRTVKENDVNNVEKNLDKSTASINNSPDCDSGSLSVKQSGPDSSSNDSPSDSCLVSKECRGVPENHTTPSSRSELLSSIANFDKKSLRKGEQRHPK